MKLTKLTLDGFKSFAHLTDISFDNGITVLVGPNGCGKSNIVDAIKWVLGDRSIKSLRGEEMADVIFNGASEAKPAGYASVSLSFSNTEHNSPFAISPVEGGGEAGQFADRQTTRLPLDYEEITISRRLYRDGQSEYFINNQSCRLKDIRELFMGTGLGMEFYSIIEQGKVDLILNSNHYERRELLDEAAGISKYKAKRRESETRLQRIEQDLLRLSDVLREVRRQIRSIKIQATKAEKYKVTLEELRTRKTQLALYTYHQYKQRHSELSDKLTQLKSSSNNLEERLKSTEEKLIDVDKEIILSDNNIIQQQTLLINLSGKISETKQKIESFALRHQELLEEEKRTKNNIAVNTQKVIELHNKLVEIMQSYETVKREIESIEQGLESKNSIYKGINEELDVIARNLEEKRNETLQTSFKKSSYQNELTAIQQELKNLSLRRDKLTVRRKEIEEERATLTNNRTKIETSRNEIQEATDKLKSEFSQVEIVIKALKNDLLLITQEVIHLKDELNRTSSRKEALEDLERHYEGCEESVKVVLKNASDLSANIYGLVADIIEIKSCYVTAAEAALRELADALVVHSQEDAFKIIQFVADNRKGRITTIAIEKLKTFSLRSPIPNCGITGIIGYADEIVQDIKLPTVSAEIKSALARLLLGNYLLVDNLSTAQQVIQEHIFEGKVLTLKGEIISSNGIISGGSIESDVGIISRKTELRSLNEQLLTLSERLKSIEQIEYNKQSEISETELNAQKLRGIIYEQSIALIDLNRTSEELERRIALISKETEINELEQSDVEQQIQSLTDRAISTAQLVKELENCLLKLQSEIEVLSNSSSEYLQKKQSVESEITELKVNQAKTISNRDYLLQTQAQLNNNIQQLEEELEKSVKMIALIQQKITELSDQNKSDEALLEQLSTEQEETQSVVGEIKIRMQKLKDDFSNLKTEEDTIQNEIDTIQENINEVNLQEREITFKMETICEKHKEETQSDLNELYATYPATAGQTAQAEFQSPETFQQVSNSIEELKGRLSEMKDVSLSSIDELKALEERNSSLGTQEQDLIKSKEALLEFIRKTNKECRERFSATFEAVNENFNQLFRKLFGGGRAELVLESQPPPEADEPQAQDTSTTQAIDAGEVIGTNVSLNITSPRRNDIFESGIDIIAKPPGKEPTSIKLLSGGEKALTALALIMAIFKLQPSPFCVMDEADSPLDENNTDRFCALIKEFTQGTQFIIITHNKRTMLSGDVLYGLTMPTAGISRKISIKMDEVDKILPQESPR
ncbi:MAG: AAA family ATPase [Planctomycetota bacterium]|nr:AAA family ATPase [Planctomycetota bacterium]MDI6787811.1 AAA family ATPase [Planctomycetota bacterium]